jgi:hypothetical protein
MKIPVPRSPPARLITGSPFRFPVPFPRSVSPFSVNQAPELTNIMKDRAFPGPYSIFLQFSYGLFAGPTSARFRF